MRDTVGDAMRWTKKRVSVFLLTLCLALGLGLILTSVLAGEADPADGALLPPVEETDGRAGACYSFYYGPPPDRPFIQMALDAGSRWDRFDFSWPRLDSFESRYIPQP